MNDYVEVAETTTSTTGRFERPFPYHSGREGFEIERRTYESSSPVQTAELSGDVTDEMSQFGYTKVYETTEPSELINYLTVSSA